jgi:MFS family permease
LSRLKKGPREQLPLAALSEKKARKVAVASFVGTALESYDQYVYAWLAALFVGPLFFEPLGPVGGVLASFATFAIVFFVRPLGAIYFGHLGDRIGRRTTLIITIILMGVATGAIGLLPTYEQAGWVGAIILVVLRLGQGLSLGGEWGGAVALTTEHANPKNRQFFASLVQLGSPVGSILSNMVWLAIFLTVPYEEIITEGWWRIPLLTAFPLLLIALYLRWSIDETPVFKDLVEKDRRALPLPRGHQAGALCHRDCCRWRAAWPRLLHPHEHLHHQLRCRGVGLPAMEFTLALTIGSVLQLITIPTFGWLANKYSSLLPSSLGRRGNTAGGLPAVLDHPRRHLLRAGHDHGGRRNFADRLLGSTRRHDGRPV